MSLRRGATAILLTSVLPSLGKCLLDLSYKSAVIFDCEEFLTLFASLTTSAVLPSDSQLRAFLP